ncbi:MAG: DegV family protein [Firmicutes bacterium]|nr:DegV family protein [Bacillota bacterium]
MRDIQVVTDSTAYISKEYARENGIDIVPLSVEFNGETKPEGYPGEFNDFYNKLKTSESFPKTSQPSVGAFRKVFERAIKNDKEIIVILISSKLSGTYNSAKLASTMVNEKKISIIDSKTSASNLKTLVNIAVNMNKKDFTRQEIVDNINEEKNKMSIYLTVHKLDYLYKGGRLSASQALLGSLLKIRPVIGLIDGELVPVKKLRGKNKALNYMIDIIPEDVKRISICYILNYDFAKKIKRKLEKKFKDVEITIDELGPVIGAHLGPNSLGLCYSV